MGARWPLWPLGPFPWPITGREEADLRLRATGSWGLGWGGETNVVHIVIAKT